MQVFNGSPPHYVARVTQQPQNQSKNLAWYVLSRCAWRPKTALARRSRDRCHTECVNCREVVARLAALPETKGHAAIHRSHAKFESPEEARAAVELYRYDRKQRPGTPAAAAALHVGFRHAYTSAAFLEAFNLWKKRDELAPNTCDVCEQPAYEAGNDADPLASMCVWPRDESERAGYHVACRKRVCDGCAETAHPHAEGVRGRYCETHCTSHNHISADGVAITTRTF